MLWFDIVSNLIRCIFLYKLSKQPQHKFNEIIMVAKPFYGCIWTDSHLHVQHLVVMIFLPSFFNRMLRWHLQNAVTWWLNSVWMELNVTQHIPGTCTLNSYDIINQSHCNYVKPHPRHGLIKLKKWATKHEFQLEWLFIIETFRRNPYSEWEIHTYTQSYGLKYSCLYIYINV